MVERLYPDTHQRTFGEAEDVLLGFKERVCGAPMTFIGVSWRAAAVEDESRVSAVTDDGEEDERSVGVGADNVVPEMTMLL